LSSPFDDIYDLGEKLKYVEFLESDLSEENYTQYLSLLHECANEGSKEAILKLAAIHQYGDEFTDSDDTAALEMLKVAFAKFKYAEVAQEIAEIYWLKNDEDEIEATNWYKVAADLGHGDCCQKLGTRYRYGWGCTRSIQNAIRYYELAIIYGHTPAYHELAEIYLDEKENTKAVKTLLDGATRGNRDCQYRYSVLLHIGELVKKDPSESLMWLNKAADLDHAKAQFILSNKYLQGWDVKKDIHTAFKWLERSAKNHYQRAQFQLYTSYLCGTGIEKNITLAFAWLLIAIRNSSSNDNLHSKQLLSFTSNTVAAIMDSDQIERAQLFRDEFTADRFTYTKN
jgi:TPR repeat protein